MLTLEYYILEIEIALHIALKLQGPLLLPYQFPAKLHPRVLIPPGVIPEHPRGTPRGCLIVHKHKLLPEMLVLTHLCVGLLHM